MKKSKHTFSLWQCLTSVMMAALLVWLTVCLPIVNQSQKATKAITEQGSGDTGSGNTNPLSNTNEEKCEGGVTLLSEYLHEVHHIEHHFTTVSIAYKGYPSGLYIAYHPDLLIPPPEA